jgi:hypothetical protein
MSGGEDPDNRDDFPGGWPGAAQSAFSNRTPRQTAMHDSTQGDSSGWGQHPVAAMEPSSLAKHQFRERLTNEGLFSRSSRLQGLMESRPIPQQYGGS